MPGPARQHPRHILRPAGVIEDQQPPVPLPQLGQHRPPRRRQPRPGLGAAQLRGQPGQLLPDQPRGLGVDPPHQVIAAREPVRVLDRQLRLADPAHAVQRLHHRPVPGQQRLPHRHQQPIAPGEPRVAGRDVPHPRPAPRPPRPGPARRRPGLPGNPGLRAGRPGPATASSSARRAASSSHPEYIRGDQRPQQRRHLLGRNCLHPHRHQPPLRHPRHVHQRR